MKKIIFILFVLLAANINSFSQVKFGADVYSRYIWRGIDFGNSPAFQPSLTFTTGGLSIGAWGSYAFPTAGTTYSENDLWATYSISSEKSGTFSILFTDYYIPSAGIQFGFYKPKTSGSAAHTVEGGLSYVGPESVPISFVFYTNLSNDPENSSYIQVGYPIAVGDATVTFAAGFVPSKCVYYLTDKSGFINLSITAAKSIAITDKFSVPINVSYIANPALDKTYLAFGAGFIF
ncbi:hypothetical protein C0389_07345 [bacterium]|nr:hypothetical protein [bacterium]